MSGIAGVSWTRYEVLTTTTNNRRIRTAGGAHETRARVERRQGVAVINRSSTQSTAAVLCGLGLAGLALSGCMSSPTYGTDKTAGEQLVTDVSGILSLTPPKREAIAYQPRPELVKPTTGEVAQLPEPQQNVATDDPAWPESPERKRARLRAEADANRNTPGWTPEIDPDMARASAKPKSSAPLGTSSRYQDSGATPLHDRKPTPTQQREKFQQQLAANRQGSPTSRKFLSEPPLEYRKAAETAPTDDLGEDELKKERRLKAAARKKSGGGWADLWPF